MALFPPHLFSANTTQPIRCAWRDPESDFRAPRCGQEVSLINPKIVETSEATDVEDEACLSFPDIQGKVRRHKWIKVLAHPPQLSRCDVFALRYMLT